MTVEALRSELLRLQTEERWSELRKAATAALSVVTDAENVARLHLYISLSVFETLESPRDWALTLDHARLALRFAPETSILHFVALQKCASLCVDLGKFIEAKRHADAYLAHEPALSETLESFTPYVLRDRALCAEYARHFDEAVRFGRQALEAFEAIGNTDEASRTATNIAWAYVKAGRTRSARAILPDAVPESIEYLRDGVLCAILLAEKRYDEAYRVGRKALEHGKRVHFDYVEAAETALLLSRIALKLGKHVTAFTYLRRAQILANRQGRSAFALLVSGVLDLRGGVVLIGEANRAGVSHPSLLAGAVFTTGVA